MAGKSFRQGLSLLQLQKMFPDDITAQRWLEGRLWPDGPECPRCGSRHVQADTTHPNTTHRCRECARAGQKKTQFSLKTGTLMHGSKLGYQKWAFAIYIVATGIKGTSSMKIHRDLEVQQKTAWHLAHRIRKAFTQNRPLFAGPVETDETAIGGKEENRHASKKLHVRGTQGKAIVAGLKDRRTNRVQAEVVHATDRPTLHGFIRDYTVPGATVYTDDALAYKDLWGYDHESVNHSAKEYVRDQAHTNGVESFWALLKRGYHGTFHHLSEKHLQRYVGEFAGRHNIRSCDTLTQMGMIAQGLAGENG